MDASDEQQAKSAEKNTSLVRGFQMKIAKK